MKPDFEFLLKLHHSSMAQQRAVRSQTFAPDDKKTLRMFSAWEVSEVILGVKPSTFRKRLADKPDLPQGRTLDESARMRWFTLDELNELREKANFRDGQRPYRPKGRAARIAVSNFKGGVGKTVVTHHMAHAAALAGYKVLCIEFDPQATLTHSFGLSDVDEEQTVWGIMCRDLCKEADRIHDSYPDPADCPYPSSLDLPSDVRQAGSASMASFIRPTSWSTIDIIPSCANAAFVEFASAQYRSLHKAWSFFGCMSRYLSELDDDAYDLIFFDCPPAIGYQSLNAAFAADILFVPSGPGYWEYDSTTSYLGQLGNAIKELSEFSALAEDANLVLPKVYEEVRILMTRFDQSNALHQSMKAAFQRVFGDSFCKHQIASTRSVEQSGRFQNSIYEQDYRETNRDTWRRGRDTFQAAFDELYEILKTSWPRDLEHTDAPGEGILTNA